MSPTIQKLSCYNEILSTICSESGGARFLDIGCYCGTDLRRLWFDGCPQEHLYGADIVDHWDLGHSLYRDKESFRVKFIQTDLLNPSAELLSLAGKISVIGATHLLHNWNWALQVQGVSNMIRISKLGTKIVGFQGGTVGAGMEKGGENIAPHSVASFERLWKETGEATETEWHVQAEIRDLEFLQCRYEENSHLGEDFRFMEFVATRVY